MDKFITVRGLRSRLIVQGQGSRVLFLHGAGGMSGWPEFFERLAQTHEVWFPEHPGFGLSDESTDIADVQDLARYYVEYIAANQLVPAHVIGSSFGGWLASELAVLNPSVLRSLILIGPAGLCPRAPSMPGTKPPSLEAFTRKLYFDQRIADAIIAAPSDEHLQRIQTRNRAAAARIGGAFHNPALRTELGRLGVPALVIWGANDQLVPVVQATQWQEALRQCELEVLQDCGHLPHLERAIEVADRITRFLANIEA